MRRLPNALAQFLSHLCGGELGDGYEQRQADFLSHLCGGEPQPRHRPP
ncbi:hypothetical protein KRX19_01340 [Cardiobacteriaceae bacterium TAE3-ERU3]|nr:hypothetical protein [Cardiobacteriaceae bacterium TAE3-ERU3]